MPNRTVREPNNLCLELDSNFGSVLSATIAEAPRQYLELLYLPTEKCALCGLLTVEPERVPTSVSIEFDQIKGSLGFCSWVHAGCLEELEPSEKPTPIPW
jgi:hypothetical protein